MARSNVVALRPNPLPALRVAATAGTGALVHGSRNEVWAFRAYCEGEPVRLFVKLGLSERAMMVEILCAQLASCLGIGASQPYLVTVNPRHAGRPAGAPVLAFGVEDVSDRSAAKPIRSLDVLFEMLDRLKVSDLACAFDEWILNDVRSPSDILVGTDGQVYFIDHEAALDLRHGPGAVATNWMADRLLQRLHRDERPAFLKKLRARLAALHRLELDQVPSAVQFSQDGVRIYTDLLSFLRHRLEHLDRIASERVLPQQRHLDFAGDDTPHTTNPMRHVPG